MSRSKELQEPTMKERIFLPVKKLNRFTNHTTSYSIKNPTGELFTYTPSGKVRARSLAKYKTHLCDKVLNNTVCVPSSTEGGGVSSEVTCTA